MGVRSLALGGIAVLAGQTLSLGVTGPYSQRLATLILYDDTTSLRIPRDLLEGMSTIYRATNTLPTLTTPDFHAIVVTSSSFNGGNWADLRAYAAKYDVRIVCLNSDPKFVTGVQTGNGAAEWATVDRTDFAKRISDVFCETCFYDMRPDAVDPKPATITNTTSTIPIMRFTATPNAVDAASPVAAVVTKTPQGTEEMHFFFNAAAQENDNQLVAHEYTKLNLALGNMWFQWATRGVYVGMRRLFLQMHVDDWFSSTTVYGTTTTTRLEGKDAEYGAKFADAISSRLPAGSRIYFEPAFNGANYRSGDADKAGSLEYATRQLCNSYNWVSHTFSHQNLDYLEPSQCNGQSNTCVTEPLRVEEEITFNAEVGRGEFVDKHKFRSSLRTIGYASVDAGEMFANDPTGLANHFSPSCLVPPAISGIWPGSVTPPANRDPKPIPRNVGTIQALYKTGIRTVTGDNSRPELVSKVSPYHGIWVDMVNYGISYTQAPDGTVDGILIIPRHAVNVFYDCPSIDVYMKEYTDLKACEWGSGPKCTPEIYNSFEKMINREAQGTTDMFLSYRPDPYMFHQANMKTFDYNGQTASLLSIWANHTIYELTRFVNKLPITSPTMEYIGKFYRNRMLRDACGIQAFVDKDANGNSLQVRLLTVGPCKPVISVNGLVNPTFKMPSGNNITAETYGPDTSYTVNMYPFRAVAIPLSRGTAPTPASTRQPAATNAPAIPVKSIEAPTTPKNVVNPVVSSANIEETKTTNHGNTVAIAIGVSLAVVCTLVGLVGLFFYRKLKMGDPKMVTKEVHV
eukprot:comp22170_c0_seq1/m.32532 comp22170_c0_seq1/g.32532  ORF comp22170_c0_seq1/g.32532 comp22170_c0_seq1/m.32532 type:complete len:798 (-) comp22170_c0_seq1:288-2681(-)